MAFATEDELVEAALSHVDLRMLLELPTPPLLLREPKGLFGVPDAVLSLVELEGEQLVCVHTSALEMKLRNWRRALQQAFRYRLFADISFVVLDAAHARPALKCIDRFQRAGVGLLTLDAAGDLIIHHLPKSNGRVCQIMTQRWTKIVQSHFKER